MGVLQFFGKFNSNQEIERCRSIFIIKSKTKTPISTKNSKDLSSDHTKIKLFYRKKIIICLEIHD